MTGATRASQPREGSQWKPLDNRMERKSGDALAIKRLHSRRGRCGKTGGRRTKEGGGKEKEALRNIPRLFFHPCNFFTRTPSNAGDRVDISTTKCIDFIQSGENKSGGERGLKMI